MRSESFETFKEYNEPGVWRYKGGMLRSHDEGRTWGEQVISAASDFEGDPHDTMWWDPRIARLSDVPRPEFALLAVKSSGMPVRPIVAAAEVPVTGNTAVVGWMLYTSYLIPFEIASMLLLVAMIGAIVLAKREL